MPFIQFYLSKYTLADAAGVGSTGMLVIDIALIAVLLICAFTDARQSKIFNVVTFPAMLAGLVLNGGLGAMAGAGASGLVWALLGWAVGRAIHWVPWMLGFAKAGDVKFLAAVGALKGWAFCVFGFLYGAAAFGILILPWLAWRGELRGVGRNIGQYFQMGLLTRSAPDAPAPTVTKKFVPWGVGLAVGFFIALIIEWSVGRPVWVQF